MVAEVYALQFHRKSLFENATHKAIGFPILLSRIPPPEEQLNLNHPFPKKNKRTAILGFPYFETTPMTLQPPSNWWFGLVVWWLGRGFPFTLYKNQGFKSHHQSKPPVKGNLTCLGPRLLHRTHRLANSASLRPEKVGCLARGPQKTAQWTEVDGQNSNSGFPLFLPFLFWNCCGTGPFPIAEVFFATKWSSPKKRRKSTD